MNFEDIIKSFENKESNFYFFGYDTKSMPMAAIQQIYEYVVAMNNLGYKAYVMYDKADYTKPEWLGESLMKAPVIITGQDVKIKKTDFVFIPEFLTNIMQETEVLPCRRIVLSQSYTSILDMLSIGSRWSDYKIGDTLTTSNIQKDYIESIFPEQKVKVIKPIISQKIKKIDKLKKPIISILTRDQRVTLSLVKEFYLRYPNWAWVTFKDIRGMNTEDMNTCINDSCLSVWVDELSSFGTFPIESMACGTTVIGKIPDMIPEWMIKDEKLANNGIWLSNKLEITDEIHRQLNLWLEDSLDEEIINGGYETARNFNDRLVFNQQIDSYIKELINDTVSKFKQLYKIEENV